MRRTAAVASIMFAFGFLGVRLLKPPGPPEEASPPVREAPHAAVPAIAAAPAEDASPETPEVLRARIEELLAAVPPAVPGTGVVTGRVTTRDGTPLPGARVHAEPAGEDERGEGDVSIAAVLDLIARHSRSREATADAEGAFTLTGLEDCTYEVSAEFPGYAVSSIEGYAPVPAASGETIRLIGRRLVEVPIVLVLPDGTMPAEGSVTSEDMIADTPTSWKPPRTSLFLPRGDYYFKGSARHAGKTYESEERPIKIAEGMDVPDVVLALEHKLTIRGFVRVSDAWLGAQPWVSVREPGKDEGSEYRHVDDGGGFEFTGLAPGTYTVQAGRFDRRTSVETVVELADKDVMIELDLPPLSPEEYTVLRVLGPDGAPLPRESCTIEWSGSETYQRDGTWWLLHTEEAQERPPSVSVSVRAKSYGYRRATFSRDAREVVVQFAEPAALEIVWSGLDPRLARADTVDLKFAVRLQAAEERRERRSGASAAAGRLRMSGLSPGRYTMDIRASCFGSTICATEIDLRSGENRFDVPLGGFSTLTVAVDPALRGRDLRIMSVSVGSPFGEREKVGDDGIVVFPLLRPGEYRLAVQGSSLEGDMEVTAPCPFVVRFEPRPADRLLVLDAGRLEAAGVRRGDCIVGIESVAVTNVRALRSAALLARARKTVRITVARGETRLDLDVDPDAITDEDCIWHFWPASMLPR